MPYVTKEKVKEIRNNLKNQFPNLKFSVTRKNHNTLNVAIISGNMEFDSDYQQINEYYIDANFDCSVWKDTLKKIVSIMNAENTIKYIDSDYGNIPAYYTRLSIGKWDRPYIYNS